MADEKIVEPRDNLINALIKAYSEITSAEFDKVNPHFKSKYASLESVIKAVKPSLVKNGILYRQVSKYTENGICIETIFHGHGAELPTGEIFLPVDKRTAQGFGSALTYARRYSLSLACGIGSEEDDDGNQAEKEVGKKSVPKKTPVKKDEPVKEEAPVKEQVKDEEWAKSFVENFVQLLVVCKTVEDISSLYKANGDINILKEKFPEEKTRLDAFVIQHKETITNTSEEV
tara:strand:+ start:379 stop:1071 length:693 start_codon:yes stop_codon:yes gene_type:complete